MGAAARGDAALGAGVTRRRGLGLGLGLGLVGLVWVLWPGPSDEDRIRAVVHAVAEGAEAGDVGDVLVHVSSRYRASEFGIALDRAGLRGALIAQFLRRGPVAVVIGPIEVVVEGDTATARFEAVLSEGTGRWQDLVPVGMDGWSLEVGFVREEGDTWRVVHHTRERWTEGAAPLAGAPP